MSLLSSVLSGFTTGFSIIPLLVTWAIVSAARFPITCISYFRIWALICLNSNISPFSYSKTLTRLIISVKIVFSLMFYRSTVLCSSEIELNQSRLFTIRFTAPSLSEWKQILFSFNSFLHSLIHLRATIIAIISASNILLSFIS